LRLHAASNQQRAALRIGNPHRRLAVGRDPDLHPLLLLAVAAVFWLSLVWLLWKHGALALVIALIVDLLAEATPWTQDMSRWYA
jgi:hypothetical protein